MRYWYIDSAAFVTLMLIDKGYYDYDYEQPKKQIDVNVRRAAMSDKKLSDTLARFGVGVKKPKDMTMEELQAYAMAEAEDKN